MLHHLQCDKVWHFMAKNNGEISSELKHIVNRNNSNVEQFSSCDHTYHTKYAIRLNTHTRGNIDIILLW